MNVDEEKIEHQNYLVKTPLYSGPLDLLLDLIERAELDITKFALAQVTDQFLAYLSFVDNRDPEEITSFLVIAARLLQIKSASLLPQTSLSLNPTDLEDDPGEALAKQLLVYKRFKEISVILKELDEQCMRSYLRVTPPPNIVISKFDLSDISLDDLVLAARNVFQVRTAQPSISEVVSMPRVSIRQKIHTILDIIQTKSDGVTFKEILQNNSRMDVVISFLAILELIKRSILEAQQLIRFGDIKLMGVGQWDEKDDIEIEFKD